ncbi:hypothetical protein [Streptomyces sp. KR55]|uniref:hypothetical protein n=1 Tax=Streptomyces sp. KR55 TaxID=3457425 RepID=UPI003FD14F1D
MILHRVPSGRGATTSALRGLDRLSKGDVWKLNPEVRIGSLRVERLEEGGGCFVESLEPEQAAALRPFHLERLSAELKERQCHLIVRLAPAVPLPERGTLDEWLFDADPEPPDAHELVRCHVARHLDVDRHDARLAFLRHAEGRDLIDTAVTDGLPVRRIADLSTLLTLVGRGLAEVSDVRDRFSPDTLGLDSGTQAHIAARTLKKRAKESREQEHEAKLAEADFSAIEEDVAYRLRKRRKQEELELERMHEEHRIALQTMRMEFYDHALQDERYGLIKLRLERSPDDVDGVIELVQRHRQIPWEEARAFLATAIDGGLVGTRDVAGLVYQAAQTLTDGMREGGLRPGNRPELQRPASDGDERKYSDAGSVQKAQGERAMPGDAEKGEQDEYPV